MTVRRRDARGSPRRTVRAAMTSPDTHPDDTFEAEASLHLFGFPATPATAVIRPRSKAWRVGGAVRAQAVGLVVAPLVGLVPPHAPWALGALGGGFFFARKRWRHAFTVEEVRGVCPKCGAPVSPKPVMLRTPHPVSCDGCHHEATLEVDPTALASGGAAPGRTGAIPGPPGGPAAAGGSGDLDSPAAPPPR